MTKMTVREITRTTDIPSVVLACEALKLDLLENSKHSLHIFSVHSYPSPKNPHPFNQTDLMNTECHYFNELTPRKLECHLVNYSTLLLLYSEEKIFHNLFL